MSLENRGAVKIIDTGGDAVNVSPTGNLMVDIGAASISGDLSVNLTPTDQVSVFGNTDPTGAGAVKALLTDAAGHLQVDVISAPTTAVTGTFWQATQPVSGTFWQTTQPISGTVTANAGTGTLAVSNAGLTDLAAAINSDEVDVNIASGGFNGAVTGTFWQATQPVSIASMPTTAVTGTFWQATQPVSGTFWQATQPVSGTFWQATQPVSIASTVEVVGDVAQGTTASGNPVLIGGKYEDTYEAVDDDEVRAIAITRQGAVNTVAQIDTNWGTAGGLNNPVQLPSLGYEITDAGMTVMGLVNHELAPQTNVGDGEWAHIQLDQTGALYTTHGITGMVSEVNGDVGTSPEDLRALGDVACKRVDMMANPSNTGYIWVGDSTVANDGTGGGIRLGAGDFYSVDVDSVNDIHVAATVNGETIMYTYYT